MLLLVRMCARLAQSVGHGTLNPRVVGSSPTLGEYVCIQISNAMNMSGNGHVCSAEAVALCKSCWFVLQGLIICVAGSEVPVMSSAR